MITTIKAIAFDFDGVFTDNKVIVSEDGKEYSNCNRYDGYGIRNLNEKGIHMCCITSEIVPISVHRCRKLGLRHFSVGNKSKVDCLINWLNEIGISAKDAAYLGNDINDLGCLQYVGYPFCPADSHYSVLKSAQILDKKGGEGVVRELADMIIERLKLQ